MNHFFRPHSANKQRSPAKNAVLSLFFIYFFFFLLLLYELLLSPACNAARLQLSSSGISRSSSCFHFHLTHWCERKTTQGHRSRHTAGDPQERRAVIVFLCLCLVTPPPPTHQPVQLLILRTTPCYVSPEGLADQWRGRACSQLSSCLLSHDGCLSSSPFTAALARSQEKHTQPLEVSDFFTRRSRAGPSEEVPHVAQRRRWLPRPPPPPLLPLLENNTRRG